MPNSDFKVVIIGSGFGGQCAAIECLRGHLDDFVILERRDFVGGTWSQNNYPGAAVDVQSLLYSLSFEQYDWSRMFAKRDELKAYTESIFEKYGLHQKTRTQQNVTRVVWLENSNKWQITINDSERIHAQFVINASGPLSKPITPKFEGQEKFKGAAFHTNEWDHSIDLEGKNIAIIGSGASAAQVIPAIVDKVKSLHVFQRTPHWVLPRWDIKFRPWQRRLLAISWVYSLLRVVTYWLLEFRIFGFKYSRLILRVLGTKPAKKHLKAMVKDVALRKKLTPEFTIGCKRIIVSSALYPALVHQNTSVHDKHDALIKIQETAVVTSQNNTIPIDVIVYATGYDATDGIISYPVEGRDAALLSSVWADYPRAYLGTSIPNFPNLFIVTGPNTGIGHTSALFMIEAQMRYIMNCINTVIQSNKSSIEVTDDAEAKYTSNIHSEMEKTVWYDGGCNSWYKSKSGRVIAMFPGFSFNYRRMCNRLKLNHHTIKD